MQCECKQSTAYSSLKSANRDLRSRSGGRETWCETSSWLSILKSDARRAIFFPLLFCFSRNASKMEMEEGAGEKKRGMAALPVTVVSACRLQTGMRAVCVRWVL